MPRRGGRHRPELKGYVSSALRNLESTKPRDWVSAVMSSRLAESPGPSGFPMWYADWRFGEVREAIRREYEARGKEGAAAMRAAHLVTSRGLADLRELGAIDERDGRLHLSEGYPTWTWLSGTLMEIGIAVAARARQLKVRAPMPEGWVPPPGWAMLSSWLGRSEPGLVVFYHSAASAMAPRAMSPQDIQTFRRLIEQTRKGQTKRSRER